MTGEMDPKQGLMDSAAAYSSMQQSMVLAEQTTGDFVIGMAVIHAYQEQISGDKEIYQWHSNSNYQFSITVAQGISQTSGGGYTVSKEVYHFDDPGLPPPSMTGTQAGEDKQITLGLGKTWDTMLENYQGKMQSMLGSSYSTVITLSQMGSRIVQAEESGMQEQMYNEQLLQSKLG
jgi:hypothetical protein